jgi:pSer/pThr/pTyr-binding forkhead associated (FHA) protein
MAQFRFIMRSGPTVGKVFPLEAPEISIGRDNTNTIAISDAEVSRRHARMELRGSAYVIQDLGSTNGTFVNGMRVSGIQVLNTGDMVSFGEGIVMAYETVADMNATVVSNTPLQTVVQHPVPAAVPRPAPVSKPAAAPASPPAPTPAPVFKTPPAPDYSGKVPASSVPEPAPEAKEKKKFPLWVLIVVPLLLIICACVGFFLVIDQFNLWCKVVPFLVPILGGSC